jgi:bifunctional DNase/RNase
MLKVFVSQVGSDAKTGNAVVLLNEPDGERMLPIWIGSAEATAISWALQDIRTDRPLTHQLLFNTIKALDFSVEKVEITEIKNQAFLAKLYLSKNDPSSEDEGRTQRVIDARPSDAIALALLDAAPIFVAPSVFAQAAISLKDERKLSDSAAKPPKRLEEDELFKNFVKDLKASDFKMPEL